MSSHLKVDSNKFLTLWSQCGHYHKKLILWLIASKTATTTSLFFQGRATPIAAFKEANLLHELCVSSIMTSPGQRHKQSADIRPRTQTSLPSIFSEFVAERWGTCQGREEGIGGRAEWSEIDAGCWRKLTAHGNWDLEIICYLSVKTRCEAILDCCSCSPICRGPEWKWPVVEYVCVQVSMFVCVLHAGIASLLAKLKNPHVQKDLHLNSEAKHKQTHAAYRFTSQGTMKTCDSLGLTFN